MSRGLPRLQRRLLAWMAPPALREVLLDDVEEEFLQLQSTHGRPAARRWLRGQLASLDWLRLRRAASPRGRRPARRPSGSAATSGAPAGPPTGVGRPRGIVLDDLPAAFRRLRRRPGFALSVVATIAVGILGVATVLAVVDTVLLQPLPYERSDRLVTLRSDNERIGISEGPVSWVNLGEWATLTDTFDGMFAVQGTTMVLGDAGPPQRLIAARVSPAALDVLGIDPVQGRGFREEEATAGNDRVVLLSYPLWRTTFGADPAVLGRSILLDDVPHRVIGVLPPDARLPVDLQHNIDRDIWLPLAPTLRDMPRIRRAVSGHARLADGVSIAAAQSAIDALLATQTTLDPQANEGWTVRLRSAADAIVGPFRNVLRLMMVAASLLLLLGCVNLINLMLAHGMARRTELRVRTALGAARRRLVSQFLADGLLLGSIGGVVGLLATIWLLALFTRLTPGNVPRLEQAALHAPTVILTLAVAAALGLVFAGVPALLLTRPVRGNDPGRAGAGLSTGRLERRVLRGMVVVQVALAVVLLVGAGLLGRGFLGLLRVDSGFDAEDVLVVQLVLAPPGYPDRADQVRFAEQALERLAAIPAVTGVGVTNFLPYSGTNTVDGFEIGDHRSEDPQQAGFRAIDPGYLDVLRVPVLAGRPLEQRDLGDDSPGALINEAMAAKFFSDVDPIGQLIRRDETWMQIVGVVANVRHDGPEGAIEPEWYAPFTHDPYPLKAFVLRTALPPREIAAAARAAFAELDPRLAPLAVQTMDDYLDEHLASPRFNSAALAAFALVAILIAAQGIFAVMAQSVARRRHEIGIRLALGARDRQLRNRVLLDGLLLAAAGTLLGFVGAVALARLLQGMLLGVSPFDAATFAAVAVLALAISGAACFLPARRAAAVEPITALRG